MDTVILSGRDLLFTLVLKVGWAASLAALLVRFASFRRLVFTVDFFIFSVGEFRCNEASVARQQAELIGSRAGSPADLGADNRWNEWLGVHVPSPVQRMANAYVEPSRLDISLDILRGST